MLLALAAHLRRGGRVLGICAGFQMLGQRIVDADGIEGPAGETEGLGLLDIETRRAPAKRLARVSGREIASGAALAGYEMHMGRTEGPDLARPMLELAGHTDGAVSTDGRVMGCYLHGLFAADGFRHAFLVRLAERDESGLAYGAEVEAVLDRLARHLESALDLDLVWELAAQRCSQTKTMQTSVKRPAAWR